MTGNTNIKEIMLPPIRNGTVIDHITCGQALNVMRILNVNENNIDSSISIGIHVSSEEMEWKDTESKMITMKKLIYDIRK